MKSIIYLSVISCLFLTTSCATLFTGTKQTVQINSKPPGAKIQIDGIDRGTTPAAIKLKKKSDGQVVTLKLDGYETKTIVPETSFNAVSILNLTNILFWGIDLLSGAVYKYDPRFYEIELEPANKK